MSKYFFLAALLLAVSANPSPAAEPETVTIPLDTIWARNMPGTRDIRKLDWKQIQWKELLTGPQGVLQLMGKERAEPGFVVAGTGQAALVAAHKKSADDPTKPPKSLPHGSECSIVFFTHAFPPSIALDKVERKGKLFEVRYYYDASGLTSFSTHIALIPAGKLETGNYRVKMIEVPTDVTPQLAASEREAVSKVVSQSFTFRIEEEERTVNYAFFFLGRGRTMFYMCRTSLIVIIYCNSCLQNCEVMYASSLTLGPNGINSIGLTLADGVTPLDGTGIGIGMVEPSRAAMMGVDAANTLNSTVNPTAVFRQDGAATVGDLSNAGQADHAMQVAGVLISTDPVAQGVAPGGSLYSSTHDTGLGTLGNLDDLTMRTIQHVATQPSVKVVNHSYRKSYTTAPDGNDLLSAGLDWSALTHNVLHVVAGANTDGASFSPKANFNGMVVGSSSRVGNSGKYTLYDSINRTIPLDGGGRTAIDLLAPGIDVQSTLPNNMLTPNPPQVPINMIDDGASFAAPHVTGTAALLHQYAADRVAASAANWTGSVSTGPTAQRHEVMKAVLMNSADKIEDTSGTGKYLGMERTMLKSNANTWLDSNAATDAEIPLDEEMGAGHLNAKRALQQLFPVNMIQGVSRSSAGTFKPPEV